jgi:EAL domain-containing protein (putative c-di-GMP-specific phosphodiesterase class I)/GGDEF domain-containing protein
MRNGGYDLAGMTTARVADANLPYIGRFDHVTRLPNRIQFLDDYARLVAGPSVLAMVTLDEARHYNEILRALGHAFADGLVQAGAAALLRLVPPETAIYHVSVLSFAFVMPAVTAEQAIETIAPLVSHFATALPVQDIPIKTEVGIGLTAVLPGGDGSEALRASLAAAQDSRRGQMGWAWYNHKTDEAHRRAFRLLSDLPEAISSNGQLSLNFQPRVSLASGLCVGAEALLRWRHPVLGAISPGEFIPLAEQTALIGPLTDWVLQAAIAQAGSLERAGTPLRVSINASPANLSEPGFDTRLLGLCRDLDVDHEHIEIEFTESTITADVDRATAQLSRLRDAGIEVAIDDFGAGFANLNYLTRIPADVVKIDQSLIMAIDGSDRSSFLVRQIIEMARGLEFRVCAEGIETQSSCERLRDLGCDEGQGYFLARPMPPEQLGDWLVARR